MNRDQRKLLYKQAIEKWGAKSQMEMAQEEATELALAIRKQVRKNDNESFKNMAGEIADMEIMIEQLKDMHPQLNERVEQFKITKLIRLECRINLNDFEAE